MGGIEGGVGIAGAVNGADGIANGAVGYAIPAVAIAVNWSRSCRNICR
jgi:hypothetical protein